MNKNRVNLDFIGYPNYSIDIKGDIYYNRYDRLVKFHISKNGYYRVTLCRNGTQKKFLIHRLVAMAFIPNPYNKPCVDHIDGDKTNNSANNLRWVTHKENSNNQNTIWKLQNENNPMWGKHLTEETKCKISESKKGRHCGTNNPRARAVLQYTKDGQFIAEYSTMKEAAKKTNSNENKICMVCKGKRNIAGGYIWKYKYNTII